MISVENIHKHFGFVHAVNDVSFKVQKGQIFGLLGPNGAGKTTTLRMMYGLIKPDSGNITMDGESIFDNTIAAQKRIGALPDGGSLYSRLTARENIAYFAKIHGMTKREIDNIIGQLSDYLNMHDILDRKTQGFSQGERMKVNLARALVHNPDYLYLDEPTNGLDVVTTRAVRNLLLELKNQNKCIIFSSHLMHEVSNLCDAIGIISNSQIVHEGTIAETLEAAQKEDLESAFIHFAYSGNKTRK